MQDATRAVAYRFKPPRSGSEWGNFAMLPIQTILGGVPVAFRIYVGVAGVRGI